MSERVTAEIQDQIRQNILLKFSVNKKRKSWKLWLKQELTRHKLCENHSEKLFLLWHFLEPPVGFF